MMSATEPDADRDARLLAWLQGEYGEWWWIVRLPSTWRATRRVHDDREPTVEAATAEELAEAMEHPARRIGWWDPL